MIFLASVINTSLNPNICTENGSQKMQISRISKLSEGRTVAFMEGNKKGRLSEHVMFGDPALDKPLWVCLLNYSLAAKTSIFGQRGCDKNL